MKCEQKGCTTEADASFVWPGHSLRAICASHLTWAKKIAETMGFVLEVRRLADREMEIGTWVVQAIVGCETTAFVTECCAYGTQGCKKHS